MRSGKQASGLCRADVIVVKDLQGRFKVEGEPVTVDEEHVRVMVTPVACSKACSDGACGCLHALLGRHDGAIPLVLARKSKPEFIGNLIEIDSELRQLQERRESLQLVDEKPNADDKTTSLQQPARD